MKLVMFQGGEGAAVLGAIVGGGVVSLGGPFPFPHTVDTFIEAGPEVWAQVRDEFAASPGDPLPSDNFVNIVAPLSGRGRNIVGVTVNYPRQPGEVAPSSPGLYSRLSGSLARSTDGIRIDSSLSGQVDCGVTLAVVIGVAGRDIAAESALDHVFGYTICNDVTARDVQTVGGAESFRGKSFDTFCPIAPWIITADELTDPGSLALRMRINGVEKQNSNTKELFFDVPSVISAVSRGVTLEPGDIILTGTPAGVGSARTPMEFLRDGDIVECEIDGIGMLSSVVTVK
jgi:2-keto-4-pentenoate hydratase/2-oxohepta-3-ene-1,7-dioic acid hydratase in catechol pathway